MPLRFLLFLLILICHQAGLFAQSVSVPSRQDTLKGSITKDREWWDIKYYALAIEPDFGKKTIQGKNSITFEVIKSNHNRFMQIDLQEPLEIDSVLFKQQKIAVEKEGNVWFLKVPDLKVKSQATIDIFYSGAPKESTNPPWDGGISWKLDSLGRPWITLGSQLIGASVWFPCKLHQGDEPDNGASLAISVPDTLVAVGNGRLKSRIVNSNGTVTYKWHVVNPINNYGLAFYVGKYVRVPEMYKGEKGNLSTDYWVIDYNREKVHSYLKNEVDKTLKTFECWFGPYPFYEDSFKMVEAPYPGMEHQSAIAYGNGFKLGRINAKYLSTWDLKTDRLVVHEVAHEWFGNSITTKDITDRWLQEGFAGYAEELFIESQYGKKAAKDFFEARTIGRIKNTEPIIRRYGIYEDAGGHMYLKGWTIVHMLRAIVNNDEQFRKMLRAVNREFYHKTVNSIEAERFIGKTLGKNLQPFFNQYLREKDIPTFEYSIRDNILRYRFSNCLSDFVMPIKTNLTSDKWLNPTKDWKELRITPTSNSSLSIDSDFYLNVKRVE
ncbi:M1 family metallopeptidase [Pedobacter panaciterrae]|uniref:M1 family metallopeptidase n=1 Tax=Pedobacter panaciterrae TaxID=363849 RepID=UPI0025964DCE|nr:M1 family metallopeptidase [uncultured Pedobacter sp.]